MLPREMAAKSSSEPDLEQLVAQMVHLQQEHKELASVIGADPGMSPGTRKALMDHLTEEEDELAAKIAAMKPAAGQRSEAAPRLTVGSLRADAADTSLTLGSLRRR